MNSITYFRMIVACLLIIIAGRVAPGIEAVANQSSFIEPDCGLNSLYILLKLHDCPVDLSAIRSKLPPQNTNGYSFLELKNAASGLGLKLQGVSIDNPNQLTRDPSLAMLSHKSRGHFVVLKPIDGSPSLVQVFDPPSDPYVVNSDILMTDPHWTGYLLVKKRSPLSADRLIIALVTVSVLIFVYRNRPSVSNS